MFNFIKKLFGFDQATMKDAGVQVEQAPYKVEAPVVEEPKVEAVPTPVNPQITDAVTQAAPEAPAKKERKPRAEKPAKEKAAKPKKAAAMTAKKPGRKPKAK